jgi:hypothetical protein
MIEIVEMVQKPKGIEARNFGVRALLPVDPPEIACGVLQITMQDLEVRFHELGVRGIEDDWPPFPGIVA